MNFSNILQSHGLRATNPRIAILETLIKTKGPLAIDELQKKLGADMDTSTLYRSLKKMSEAGIVYQTDFRTGKAYFEYQQEHHHHIVCTNCGDTEAVQLCLDKDTDKITKQSKKFSTIKNHMLEFFGICKNCQTN